MSRVDTSLQDILIEFKEDLDEWASQVEGTPSHREMIELDGIYSRTIKNIKEVVKVPKPLENGYICKHNVDHSGDSYCPTCLKQALQAE